LKGGKKPFEVIMSDDFKEFALVADRIRLAHQICHFHLLRWLWHALEKFRKQLSEEHHALLDEVCQLAKTLPARVTHVNFDINLTGRETIYIIYT
jgi:hypothetical protein